MQLYSHARNTFCAPDQIGILTQPINAAKQFAFVLLSWKES